jgi:hypothetical protein
MRRILVLLFTGRHWRQKKLLQVELEYHPMQECNDSMTRQADPHMLREVLSVGLLDDSMLCAGVLKGGKDACQVRPATDVAPEIPYIYRN